MKKIILVVSILVLIIILSIKQNFVPNFSYLYSFVKSEGVETYKYITLASRKSYEKYLTKNIEILQSCYDESYYYDEDENITYLKYEYKKLFIINIIEIKIVREDYCKDALVLKKDWINDVSNVIDSNLNYDKLLLDLRGKEITFEGVIAFDDRYFMQYNNYFAYFIPYEDKLGVILLDQNDHKKYGFYQIDDISKYLE